MPANSNGTNAIRTLALYSDHDGMPMDNPMATHRHRHAISNLYFLAVCWVSSTTVQNARDSTANPAAVDIGITKKPALKKNMKWTATKMPSGVFASFMRMLQIMSNPKTAHIMDNAATADMVSSHDTAGPNTVVQFNGPWVLFHDTARMKTLLDDVLRSVSAWPGTTHLSDLHGPSPEPRTYEVALDELCTNISTMLAEPADVWHLQWTTLCILWLCPKTRETLAESTPLPVCDKFLNKLDECMTLFTFGKSSACETGHVSMTPIEIVTRMMLKLQQAYAAEV